MASERFLGLTNKTTADGTNPLPWLRVFPPAVTFRDAEANEVYTAEVTVRNADTRPHTVKIIKPDSRRFHLVAREFVSARLSPGLTATFEVAFATDEENDFWSHCAIQTDAGTAELPLAAFAPAPDVVVTGDLDVGVLAEGAEAAASLAVKNRGKRPAVFEVALERALAGQIRVDPPRGVVGPADGPDGGVATIAVRVAPAELGALDAAVDVVVRPAARDFADGRTAEGDVVTNADDAGRRDGDTDANHHPSSSSSSSAETTHSFRVGATVVPHAFELLRRGADGDDEKATALAFGDVLYGDVRTQTATVYNNGPTATRFSVRVTPEDDLETAMVLAADAPAGFEGGDRAGRTGALASAARVLSWEPREGTLGPYERAEVTFTVRPTRETSGRGFKSRAAAREVGAADGSGVGARGSEARQRETESLKFLGVVSFANREARLMVPITARATASQLALDPMLLDFGAVRCHDVGDHLLDVKNLCRDVPARWRARRSTYFKPSPSSGTVLPGQTASVAIRYEPKDLGPHRQDVVFECLGASGEVVQSASVRCVGVSDAVSDKSARLPGGTSATPADFVVPRKYVDPAEVARQTIARSEAGRKHARGTGTMLDREDVLERFETLDLENGHTMTLGEAKAKETHRASYVEYIRKSRRDRTRANDPDPTDAKSLGLSGQYGGGVGFGGFDRGPKLPSPVEPLWLDPAKGAGAGSSPRDGDANATINHVRPRHRPQHAVECDERFVYGGASAFPERPTTKAERVDCARVLIPKEIAKLVFGPGTVDFGDVSVGSEHVKYFSATNGSDRAIIVRVEFGDASDALRASGPRSQVVAPGETARFAVRLKMDDVAKGFRESVAYVVNDNAATSYRFDVVAKVVPVALDLNASAMDFRFEPNNWEDTVTEVVVVSNPNKDAASFEWVTEPDSAFRVSPSRGSVKGGDQVPAAITWTPDADAAKNAETLRMRVVGDRTMRTLRCVGDAGDPRMTASPKVVDFGAVPAGFKRVARVTLRNPSEYDAVFALDERHEASLEDASAYGTKLTCEPMVGRIAPGQTRVLEVTLCNPVPGKHRLELVARLRGGEPLKIPCVAEAIVPDVRASPAALALGRCFVGSSKRVAVTLRNASAVFASLKCDLRPHPEFDLEMPNDNWSPEDYDDPPLMKVPKLGQNPFGNSALARMKAKSSKKIMASRGAEDKGGNLYKIAVAPHGSLTFDLVFSPNREAPVETFALPVFLEGVEAQPADWDARARVPITCDGDEPRIKLEKTRMLAFGPQIVLREGFRRKPHVVTFTARHNDPDGPESFHWSFGKTTRKVTGRDESNKTDIKSGANAAAAAARFSSSSAVSAANVASSSGREVDMGAVFTFEPRFGTLRRGDPPTEISCTFAPLDPLLYEGEVAVYLDGGQKTKSPPYLTFSVSGEGAHPRLAFDAREAALAPTPLGVATTRRFEIVNGGFDNLRVSHKLPADAEKIPMTVAYPEGRMIGVAKPRLPVEVTFASKKPLSFTASVDFMDDDNNRFSLPVSGVADNCGLTLEPFTSANAERVDASLAPKRGDADKPVVLVHDASLGDPPFSVGDAETLEALGGLGRGADGAFLAMWLNAMTPKGPFDAGDLASQMRRGRGRALIELVEYWSGKEAPGKVLHFSPNKREACEQTLAQYEKLLTFLKTSGALLNAVKPEMLLDEKDFHRLAQTYQRRIDHREVSHAEADRMRLWMDLDATPPGREKMAAVSAAAWRLTLMQTIKIFVLSRITPRRFRATPGVDASLTEAASDPTLAGSNFFSVPEGILLRWLTSNLNAAFPGTDLATRRVVNFGSDLDDGLAYYAVLVRHWPPLEARFGSRILREDRASANRESSAALKNAETVLSMLQAVRVPVEFDAAALAGARPAERTLFVALLFHQLPQLVPRATIAFPCALLAPATRKIELTNPSQKAVTYAARLEGNPDFSLAKHTVKVPPEGKAQVPVTLVPTTSVATPCALILTSTRDGAGAAAATTTFALEPDILVDAPIRTFEFEAKTYEWAPKTIELANPYPADCEFAVRLVNLDDADVARRDAERDAKERAAMEDAARASRAEGAGVGRDTARMSRRASSSSANRFGTGVTTKQKGALPSGVPPAVDASLYPSAFGIDRRTVKLRRGDVASLSVAFLPFAMGSHRALLYFEDAAHGTFCVELAGEAGYPAPMLRVRADVDVRPQTHDVVVPFANPTLEQAKRVFLEKHPLCRVKEQADRLCAAKPWPKRTEYAVQTHSAYMEIYENLALIQNPAKGRTEVATYGDGARKELWVPGDNVAKVALNLRNPGRYPGKVVLFSERDVRVLDLEFAAGNKDDRASLEFECCARETITQEIPLVNDGDRVMSVNAKFEGETAFFTGAGRDLVVSPKGRVSYPLRFKPLMPGTYQAKLTLKTGDESITYALRGVAREPMPEETVVIESVARSRTTRAFVVPNVFGSARSVIYDVTCDLDFVGGEPKCSAAAAQEGYYDLDVSPLSSGTYRGALTFTASNGYFCWFALEIRAAPPKAEDTLRLRAKARTATTKRIALSNPSDRHAAFAVALEGHGLLGPSVMELGARSAGHYDLVYSPLLVGSVRGRVLFRSKVLGEFWYDVDATCDAAAAESVPEMRSEIGGRRDRKALEVANPTDREIALSVSSDNPRCFVAEPTKIVIPPFAKKHLAVEYAPSALDVLETGAIEATSEDAGTWRWTVSGRGEAPTKLPPTEIFVILGQSGSGQVAFPNPFREPLSVSATLEPAEDDEYSRGAFELLTKKKTHEVSGFGLAQFPFRFTPAAMTRHVAHVVVRAVGRAKDGEEALTWRFPIHAHAEAPPSGHHYQIRGKARRKTELGVSVTLDGLKIRGASELYSFELAVPDQEKSHLRKALVVKPLQASLTSSVAPLKFHLSFRPRRAMDCSVDLLVSKASGGRWRFPIHLEAVEPEIDGTIQVEAHVGQASVAVFSLPNPEPAPTGFTAYFTPDSPPEFSVTPETGIMRAGVISGGNASSNEGRGTDPRGSAASGTRRTSRGGGSFASGKGVVPRKSSASSAARSSGGDAASEDASDAIGAGPGADLRIRYAPTEYGTDLVGRLVVVTDENTWVFEVVGTIPEYEAPRPGARVSTAMDERTRVSLAEAQAPRTSNIVLQNTKPEFYTSRRLLSRTEGATTKKK